MIKSFSKLQTFSTVVQEGSFSRTAAKLGISQPAITQTIKGIERRLACKIVRRKKNGIVLTSQGEDLYKIATRMEKEVNVAKRSILNIINKKLTFKLGASHIIGTYVIPGNCLNGMSQSIDNDVNISIDTSHVIVQKLKDGLIDIGLIESRIEDNDLIYREWLEDEFILVSNVPIPEIVHTEDLYNYSWVLREDTSHTRRVVSDVFDSLGVSCDDFNMISEVGNTTVILQTLKKSTRNKDKPIVSVISKYAITDEVIKGELFQARFSGHTMTRKFYVVSSKENKHNAYVNSAIDYILTRKY